MTWVSEALPRQVTVDDVTDWQRRTQGQQITAELLRFPSESTRTRDHFAALFATAGQSGVQLMETKAYHGSRSWLVIWGPGNPERRTIIERHVKGGGRAICLDLAYWHRDQKFRVSIDAPHPQRWVMSRDWPKTRVTADRINVADTWAERGPVVIAGIGRKALTQYGRDFIGAWEQSMIAACRERWPKRQILYRRKQNDAPVPDGVALASSAQPIDKFLAGKSLVITWHSNVAVDAIRMGIPVVCRDGAASSVFLEDLGPSDPQPLDIRIRDRFLANLAWFQWSSTEATAFWAFLRRLLG